jgi:hypothetical protein
MLSQDSYTFLHTTCFLRVVCVTALFDLFNESSWKVDTGEPLLSVPGLIMGYR